MTTKATSSFEVQDWNESTYQSLGNGGKLARATAIQTFDGDITGDAAAEFLLTYPDPNNAFFCGMQRVVGKVGERSGSFVLQVNGSFAEGRAGADWFVVPGSGTGELEGLQGNGGFQPQPGRVVKCTLDYVFE
jgi:hypothetical protein